MGYRSLAVLVALGTLAAAPVALADTTDSTNWAGYSVQRPGVAFSTVRAAWTQPGVSCRPGSETYSSFWVGLGGFSSGSPALEQIGTEVDCNRSGSTSSTAWYETVPAPSYPIFRPVSPGDQMAASVTVRGHTATLVLRNISRGWTFTKSLRISSVDVSSAEWVVEAPSECAGNTCQTLPLANFGSAAFTSAAATTVRGHTGSLSDPRWQLTKIRLRPAGRQFAINGSLLAGGATPAGLQAGGSAFDVGYSLFSLQLPGVARAASVPAHRLGPPSSVVGR